DYDVAAHRSSSPGKNSGDYLESAVRRASSRRAGAVQRLEGPSPLVAPVHFDGIVDLRLFPLVPLSASGVSVIEGREIVCDKCEGRTARAENGGINEIRYGCSVRGDVNIYGPLSVGVPGFMAGVGTLWERWGALTWPEILAPAQELLENGLSYELVREAVLK